jgi:hypothetical protein
MRRHPEKPTSKMHANAAAASLIFECFIMRFVIVPHWFRHRGGINLLTGHAVFFARPLVEID